MKLKKIVLNVISILTLVVIFGSVTVTGCKDNTVTSTGDCPADQRTGAVCNDGTTSSATGSGACSSHGGVKNWICR